MSFGETDIPLQIEEICPNQSYLAEKRPEKQIRTCKQQPGQKRALHVPPLELTKLQPLNSSLKATNYQPITE